MIVKFLPKQHDVPEVILRRSSKDFQIVFDCFRSMETSLS